MPRRKTRANQDTAKEVDDNSGSSAASPLADLIAQAVENETPADVQRVVLNKLARIEAAVSGEPQTHAGEKAEKEQGGRPLDVYVGALVDFMAANAAGFGDAIADTLPKFTRAADSRVIERFLPVLAEAFDARLIERINERNRQHFAYERPRLPANWQHALADAMRRWNKQKPPGT